MSGNKVQVDIVSDAICPWCYVGKKRLEQALGLVPELEIDIAWRPYQLAPDLPPEGISRKAYVEAKFGNSPRYRAAGEVLAQLGDELGIPFDFAAIERTPNTLDAHRLIRWSRSAGAQDLVVERLFAAYFTQGLDIGRTDVLLDVAEAADMDRGLVAELLAEGADREIVRREIEMARTMGIASVPTYLVANRFPVVGAQDAEVLAHVLRRVAELTADEPDLSDFVPEETDGDD
ncbi:MAG: DsbA family oxidoreductase [Alphaproteobacteria bacterium]|nr:DsbA family oxidoreductase [Alphaproteobacteria bacterium]